MYKFTSKWIPHKLTEAQKLRRLQLSRDLLGKLTEMKENELCSLITADEAWFYLTTERDGMWAESPKEVPPRVKMTVGSPKVMVFVAWCPRGPVLIECLPPNTPFDSSYISYVLVGKYKAATIPGKRGRSLRGLVLHWDNAKPHIAGATSDLLASLGAVVLPHRPYSPDVAPCEFDLFGYLKHRLSGQSFIGREKLVEKIREIMVEIPPAVFFSVYTEWLARLQLVIDLEGEYYY